MHNRTRKTARRSRIEVRPTTLLRPQALDSLLAFGLGRVHRTPCLANDNVTADDVTMETYYYGHQSILVGRSSKYSYSTYIFASTFDLDL